MENNNRPWQQKQNTWPWWRACSGSAVLLLFVTVNPACFVQVRAVQLLCWPLKDTKRAKSCWGTGVLFVGTQLPWAPPLHQLFSLFFFFFLNSVVTQIHFIDTSSSHCCELCENPVSDEGVNPLVHALQILSITCIIWIDSVDNKEICTVNAPLYHICNPDMTHGWNGSPWWQQLTQMCASPPVPDRAALAPASVNSPPCFRCKEARRPEIVEVHTLCFHIRSAFLYKSKQERKKQDE